MLGSYKLLHAYLYFILFRLLLVSLNLCLVFLNLLYFYSRATLDISLIAEWATLAKLSFPYLTLPKFKNSPLQSEVNKFGRPKARAELSGANASGKYIFMYIVEGVHAVAWQQCKQSLNNIRQREGC